MRETIRKHHISFKNAFAGLSWAFRSQPNFRVHVVLASFSLILAYFLRITRTEFIIIVFTIVLGFTAELVNTSIEAMTDLITKEWRQEAKIAKDVAAGMMLTVAIGASFVAFSIFIPYFARLL